MTQPAVSSNTQTLTQNPDIRFLGKLLGDVIRAYGGQELFQRIESIRASSVDRYRGVSESRAVDPGLSSLGLDETLSFVRSFMLFSMLANLAEDRQGGATEAGDDLAATVQRLAKQGVDTAKVSALLDHSLIVPVLTAHPTEVMRKSMIDHRNRIAELMRFRDLGRTETPDGALIEQAPKRPGHDRAGRSRAQQPAVEVTDQSGAARTPCFSSQPRAEIPLRGQICC